MTPFQLYGTYAVIGLGAILIGTLASNLLTIGGITPDLLLLVIVALALHRGQLPALVFGFVMGLLFDIVSTDVIGSNALVKMLAGYVAGFFGNPDQATTASIGSPRYVVTTLVAALVHNAVYYLLYTRPAEISFTEFYLKNGVAAALYTAALALLPFFYASRQREETF
ncbi:MAG: rod shape-determining protein MreD [Bacteroidota bacterium]|nr:rod shape-determining protein MreD [Candidatus Kapabacteria bacterium]MCS7302613.1 rod shape-determining protein MreD [Candidatus Kapabacteria bacterium]MCX7936453.1 rod shape-determining protein MreD [Chlorobiota bacterium]MDW8074267.1 rod shape-determining protein MreD [Bacteroidota bacterium]MDW8271257.1 rod shape-determining protein MreD [Bacteroidota bacterium]